MNLYMKKLFFLMIIFVLLMGCSSANKDKPFQNLNQNEIESAIILLGEQYQYECELEKSDIEQLVTYLNNLDITTLTPYDIYKSGPIVGFGHTFILTLHDSEIRLTCLDPYVVIDSDLMEKGWYEFPSMDEVIFQISNSKVYEEKYNQYLADILSQPVK